MLLKILTFLGVALIAFLTYIAFQPSYMTFAREIKINASPAKIFPYLNRSELANRWNPWLAMDPNAKIEVSGPAEGVNAKTSWVAGKQLGTGSATIVESVTAEKVKIKLEYQEPFAMTQDAYYFLKAEGNETTVTWKIEGHNTFFSRILCTFVNMEKVMRETFDKGLADLKVTVEKSG